MTNSFEIKKEIPHFDYVIEENKLFEGSKIVVCEYKKNWKNKTLFCQLFKDGTTNKLVAVSNNQSLFEGSDVKIKNNSNKQEYKKYEEEEEVILVRVYGHDSNLLINREEEKLSMNLLNSVGCSSPLYLSFHNGIVYGFSPGEVINNQTMFDFKVQRLIAKELVRIHKLSLLNSCFKLNLTKIFKNSQKPGLFDKIYDWLSLIDINQPMPLGWTKEKLKQETKYLENLLTPLKDPVVFCHNDLLPKNIIYDKINNKVKFIDFEYCFPNYRAFDIGNFFCEFAGMQEINYDLYPDKQFQIKWLTIYLKYFNQSEKRREMEGEGKKVNGEKEEKLEKEEKEEDESFEFKKEVEKLYIVVNKFALASHVFWAIWGIVQSSHSYIEYNFLEFAEKRLNEYEKKKKNLTFL